MALLCAQGGRVVTTMLWRSLCRRHHRVAVASVRGVRGLGEEGEW
jgi:hypothetical protein